MALKWGFDEKLRSDFGPFAGWKSGFIRDQVVTGPGKRSFLGLKPLPQLVSGAFPPASEGQRI